MGDGDSGREGSGASAERGAAEGDPSGRARRSDRVESSDASDGPDRPDGPDGSHRGDRADRVARQMRLEAQRHAVLIASAVAHDVNNPIAFLSLASAELRRMVERATAGPDGAGGGTETASGKNVQLDIERLSELVREIDESATRLGRIVHELRIFTRGADAARGVGAVVDLGRLIDGALTLAAGQLGGRVRIEAPPVDSAAQAPVSLGYALLNVLLYVGDTLSRDADLTSLADDGVMPVLKIESRTTRDGEGGERGTLAVTVDVRSTAFSRLASADRETPLALELARDVLMDAGGGLDTLAFSDGHCYKLSIPTATYVAGEGKSESARMGVETVQAPGPAHGAGSRAMGPDVTRVDVRHRVLVVDDEIALARALARGLSLTYDVDVACTAADALNYLESTRYDAIVCDLHLSERSGTAIHEQVARVSTDQARRFIFTTGANASGDTLLARAIASGCPILEKPFDGRSLEVEVARVATF